MSQFSSSTTSERFSDPQPHESGSDENLEAEEDGHLTLRALVSTKEAGVIIGKGTVLR